MDLEQAQEAVREAGRHLLAAGTAREVPKIARAYFAAWSRLLKFYHPLPTAKSPSVGLPPDLAASLAGMFEYLAQGVIPKPVLSVSGGSGRDSAGPLEQRDLKNAVAYVLAARCGQIPDSNPVKTIGELFEVGRSTVQGWIKEYPQQAPRFRDGIRAANFIQEVIVSGQRYVQAGRSHAANRRRSRVSK